MNVIGMPARTLVRLAAVVAIVVIAGCAEKAKVLQTGAAQFEAESLAAIDKIDALRLREIEASPLPPSQAADLFVANIQRHDGPLEMGTVETFLDPVSRNTPESERAWQALLSRLRMQYTEFAAIFASLDRGSLFAAPSVEKAVPLLEPLVVQLAAMADHVKEHPIRFNRDRADIVAKLEIVRDNADLSETERRRQLLEQRQRLIDLVEAEKTMNREALVQCLAAAELGMSLRQLLVDYDKLSVDDIAEATAYAFRVAGTIPGLDVSGLQTRTDDLMDRIEADPVLKAFLDDALGRLPAPGGGAG